MIHRTKWMPFFPLSNQLKTKKIKKKQIEKQNKTRTVPIYRLINIAYPFE